MHNHLRKYANIAGTGCFSAALDSNGGVLHCWQARTVSGKSYGCRSTNGGSPLSWSLVLLVLVIRQAGGLHLTILCKARTLFNIPNLTAWDAQAVCNRQEEGSAMPFLQAALPCKAGSGPGSQREPASGLWSASASGCGLPCPGHPHRTVCSHRLEP